MIEFLKNWVLNIATIAILLVLIEILIPSGKTKKLVNLISGFVLLTTIIQPVFKLMWRGNDLNWINEMNNSFDSISNIDVTKGEFREEQIRQIIKVYRKRLVDQIAEIATEIEGVKGAKADIILNEDFNSKKFGEIKRVYIYLEVDYQGQRKEYRDKGGENKNETEETKDEGETSEKGLNITPVKEISEVKINIRKREPVEENDIMTKYKNNTIISLEEKLYRFFMLKKEDIVIFLE